MKNIFNIFLVFFLFFISSSMSVQAKNVKFVQVEASNILSTEQETIDRLNRVITDINSIKGLDFVVFTGDNIANSSKENLKSFLALANKLNIKYYVLLGDKDVKKSSGLDKSQYMETVFVRSGFRHAFKPNYIVKRNGFVFIIVDGSKEIIPAPNGYFRQDTLLWLDKMLSKYSKKPVILIQHFPVVSSSSSRKTVNSDEYLTVLCKYNNIISIVAGHFDENIEQTDENNIYHIITPSVTNYGTPYKIIEFDEYEKGKYQPYTQLMLN